MLTNFLNPFTVINKETDSDCVVEHSEYRRPWTTLRRMVRSVRAAICRVHQIKSLSCRRQITRG